MNNFYKGSIDTTIPSQSTTLAINKTDTDGDRCYTSHIAAPIYKDVVRTALDARNTFSELCNKILLYADKKRMHNLIEKVIFNDPATIVIWADGTKTIVKCDGEKFDPEKGLAMAISKKLLGGNNGYYYDVFEKWLSKKEKHSKKAVIKAVKKVRENFDREQSKKNK